MPIIELRRISKAFGSINALEEVDFAVDLEEIVGLIGDNGAGKSTLIKILSGVHRPDDGNLIVHGREVRHWSPAIARRAGIETVYQDKALAEQQTITQNIFMGRELTGRLGFIRLRRQEEEAERLMRRIGFTSKVFSPNSAVATLSGGERDGVAIARALYFKADLIILDEPATALSLAESEEVLRFVRQIKAAGSSAVFISHNIYQAHAVCDRLVILDRGRVVDNIQKAEISVLRLIEMLQDYATPEKVTHE